MFRRIVVAWDGSEAAERALDMAVEIARTYQAEIVAASVTAGDGNADRLRSAFVTARVSGAAGDVELEHQIVRGHRPAHDLLAFAHEHGFDLLVIGHHRHRHESRFVLHGLTEHLVSEAQLPILVVGAESRPV